MQLIWHATSICKWIPRTQIQTIIKEETKSYLTSPCKLQSSACFPLTKFNCALTSQYTVLWRKEQYFLRLDISNAGAVHTCRNVTVQFIHYRSIIAFLLDQNKRQSIWDQNLFPPARLMSCNILLQHTLSTQTPNCVHTVDIILRFHRLQQQHVTSNQMVNLLHGWQ